MDETDVVSREHHYRSRILAVDDTPANLLALDAVLEPLGHGLTTATSGAEAIKLLEREEFAVVLLDIQMPGMDGFETLQRIREGRSRNIPVIFLTAYPPDQSTVRRAYSLGAFDFLSKPIESDVLRGKVNAFVAYHARGRELLLHAQALRAKDTYIGVLAHDLRTPLAIVRMATHALLTADREQVPPLVQRILRSIERMDRLANDLLDSARTASLKMPARNGELDLGALCHELLDDFRATYPQVQFEVDIASGVIGTWDRDRLHQALVNLLSNAVKYGDGRVSVDLRAEPGQASLSVSNSGAAISRARLPTLFEPFVQGEAGRGGVGLGLHIVREIVVAHGGEVVATSDHRGTSFTIRLPLTFG